MRKSVVVLWVAVAMIAVLTGCAKKEETAAQRAARSFDKGMKHLGKGMEKAGEKIRETAKE